MKKYLPIIAGIVLGLLFIMASAMFLLKLVPQPTFPEGSPIAHYMAAFGPTGLMHFVKVFELVGGILVAIPRTRNLGLLVLGPIIVNILAFHLFITGPQHLLDPMLGELVQKLTMEERFEARLKLAELPRNSAPNRVRNRCEVTGRPRSVHRKMKMSRIALREMGSKGLVPGLVKSSW